MIRSILTLAVLCLAVPALLSQQPEPQSSAPKANVVSRPALAANTDARRFFLKLEEVDHGRKLNSRTFEMLSRERESTILQAGSRVPITQSFDPGSKSQSVQYVDVGLNIRLHYLLRSDDKLDISIDFDTSSVAPRDATTPSSQLLAPVVRQTRFNVNAVIAPDVDTLLDSMEDLTTGHTYQLSVVAKSR
ncbi:MAG TPA: hypothetical protein VGC88_08015 [Terriglobales bacterium]|jgi:hypothetical protein